MHQALTCLGELKRCYSHVGVVHSELCDELLAKNKNLNIVSS